MVNNMTEPIVTLSQKVSKPKMNGLDNPALDAEDIQKPKIKRASSFSESFQSNQGSIHSKTRFSDNGDDNPRSWWYAFCLKCRAKDEDSSWEPPFWSYLCPYPLCPSYRRVARVVTLLLIGVISWCILYTIVGDSAAPKGILFQLIILTLIAKLGGWLFSLTTLPGLIGMLFTGMAMQNLNVVDIDASFTPYSRNLRNTALVIILIRAGLDLDQQALRRLKFTILRLGLLPWFVEVVVIAVLTHYFLGLPWDYGLALGSVVAAVSPAVTVPCLLRLRSKGYGVSKGIPTLIIAIAGIDDAASVAAFRIMQILMFSSSSITTIVVQAPISVIAGIVFGIFWGFVCNYFPERGDPYHVPMRVVMVFAGCMLAVFGSEEIGYGGAGPLGCVIAAFAAMFAWTRHGWNSERNPVNISFEIIWMFFEPILFGITGASIKLDDLEGRIVLIGLGILVASSVIRIAGTVLLGIGCNLNLKEKVFCSFALMSKATVQAALAPVVLNEALKNPDDVENISYGRTILMICVLSIALTAPTSAILMTVLGPKMLTRTKPTTLEKIRKNSYMPSMRDLVVDDEKDIQAIEGNNGPVDNSVEDP